MNNLINKRAVRKLALDLANDRHPIEDLKDIYVDSEGRKWDYARALASSNTKKYKQVSASFIEHINSLVRVNVEQHIKKMTGKGSTVK
tara:strand:+ start:1310 stop:1573 length:264 start_codon:yes stop_codon:yes gene_type:complete